MKLSTLMAFFKGVDIDYVNERLKYWEDQAIKLKVENVLEMRQANIKINAMTKVLTDIANDYPELSHDKAKLQNLDHIKWAKEVLKESWIDRDKLQQALDFEEQRRNEAMNELVAWQQEFDKSAQLIGNKPTSYVKLKENFE